jgi:hypothetical protein
MERNASKKRIGTIIDDGKAGGGRGDTETEQEHPDGANRNE